MTVRLIASVILGLSFNFSARAAEKNHCADFRKSVASGTEPKKLKSFLDVQWKYLMNEYPEWATYVGFPGLDDRWSDMSLPAIERRKTENLCQKEALLKIKRRGLLAKDQINFDLALRTLELSIEGDKFPSEFMPINQMSGFHVDATQVLLSMPMNTAKDFETILKRLERYPQALAQVEALMREGLRRKVMPVKAFMPRIEDQLNELTPKSVDQSPFFSFFKDMPPSVPVAEQEKIKAKAREIITGKIYPAVTQFKSFFVKDYAPAGRESIAWTDMPNGKEWYAYLVKYHTTTNATPDELHELGLREVGKLLAEMEKVREQVKFRGDLKAFNKFLLKDKQFYYENKEDLLRGYRDIAKRIDPELARQFRTLPRLTYGVREIQEFQAKSAAGAQYSGGSPETGRPGYFEANTYDLPSRPKWDMETLTLHEAVPGHHLQTALAQEMKDLPEFRKQANFTAFVEGWALYAETLGKDLGLFKDPYSYYGHLTDQMLRAVRLVVDTGMHAKGWSKQKAWDYYRAQMPTSDIESENEINRYISWPGQALSYKVGQLKIREMREYAQKELGDSFEIRDFHDEILKNGALPMDVLEKSVKEWTAAQKKRTAATQTKSI